MASGNIGASSNNQYIVGNLNWSSVTNVAENYSDVSAELRMWRSNSGYTTTGTGNWTISIDGQQKNESRSVTLTQNSNTFIIAHTVRVYHNADGTKAIDITVSGGIGGTSYTATYCGSAVQLDTIPRASQATWASGDNQITFGNTYRINMNRASGSFTHNVRWGYGTMSGGILDGVGDYVDWTPGLDLSTMTPASTQGYGVIYVDTISGGQVIGSTGLGFYGNVPSSVIPTTTSVSTSEMTTSPNVASIVGKYVQGLSSIRMYINGYNGIYGSTIPTFKFNLNSRDWTNNGYIVDYGIADFSGTKVLTGYITDSRGRNSISRTVNVDVLPYANPLITAFTVQRCDSGGVLNELGTYAKIVRQATASSLMNGSEKNAIGCAVYYKERSSGTWIAIGSAGVSSTTNVSGGVNSTPIIFGTGSTFDITKSYDFKFEVSDKFYTSISTLVLSTGQVVMSWGQSGVGIGKVYQQGALDIGGNSYITGRHFITPTVASSFTGATSGGIDTADVLVPNNGFATGFHMNTLVGSGYRQHLSLGSFRTGSAWNGGMFVGLGGADANPTEFFLFSLGGDITHSSGRTFFNNVNSSAALSANGYQVLATGFIIQWGTTNVSMVNGTGGMSFSFPIANSVGTYSIVGSVCDSSGIDLTRCNVSFYSMSNSGGNFYVGDAGAGGNGNVNVKWIVIGK